MRAPTVADPDRPRTALDRDPVSDPSTDPHTPYPVAEAARVLGLSEIAVRSRIKRRTLATVLVDGRRLVLLPDP
jgi:hypothetical protein